MKNKKHLYLLISVILLTVFLSGCTQVNEPINAESTGVWNEYFVYPLSTVITFFAKHFSGSYGLAIVIVTLIVRLFLVPLNVKQVKVRWPCKKFSQKSKRYKKSINLKTKRHSKSYNKKQWHYFKNMGQIH